MDQADGLDHRAHRVPRAAAAFLDHDLGLVHMLGEVLGDLVPAVPGDDDEALRGQLARRGHDVAEHRPAAHLVEHLRGVILHSGALTRRENDHGGRTG